ncbi:hypothetical protein HG535_0A00970 [Zygotorulaspora mrakii]|uniref:Topoisomerase 1-associated factor 1 n=1 Tax=Zygotorulaspora mrakii TaxID=42260 RepID=A0A7H9AV47_ZYGMR|nr:uncharacterized protein HG535_0A00970 [Zygotorulaspora mrakii]QLG70158.1 hypothetical protein HG535_0A00970 [Zygotorulaspora mrakii]
MVELHTAFNTNLSDADGSLTVLRARIALLATAIGGPDYTSKLDPPPYKLGDDCLACLKDLKRWFKLVDDQQNRWDVAMAAAEYRILIDDLLPIMIDWENKTALANKLSKQDTSTDESIKTVGGREYHDNIALNSLQLLVILTWPLTLNEQSTADQIRVYSDLKKHQVVYKKKVLSLDRGKTLKAVTRLASKVVRINKSNRSPKDNMVLRLTLNFLRNILSIGPAELNIARNKNMTNRGINITDTLPPDVTLDDISLSSVISAFQRNKVFKLLLLLSGSSTEFDNDFIDVPLMEILFQITKEINQESLFSCGTEQNNENEKLVAKDLSPTCSQLTDLLQKEKILRKNVLQNTSTRHSRFGALLSIETANKNRLTVSGGSNLRNDSIALKNIDSRKKWNKRGTKKRDDMAVEGLPNTLLKSRHRSYNFSSSTSNFLKKFIDDFIDSGFNFLLQRLTSHFTTEQDQMMTSEQVEYLMFFAWFTKFQRIRPKSALLGDVSYITGAIDETSFILLSSILRKSYEEKNWVVVHAGMIAFDELLQLVGYAKEICYDENIEFILSRLFSDERIKLLSDIPKHAYKHTVQYMKSCVDLTHTAMKLFEQYDEEKSLIITKKTKKKQHNISEAEIENLVQSQGIDRDEALEILQPSFREHEVSFAKIQRQYFCESTIETYINCLQRFQELEDSDIKKGISFLHRVITRESEEALLFRIDFIVLLRNMLSTGGISRRSRVRKHVESFSNFFLYRLKKKLKDSSSWFIALLFPLLHNSDIGYFQKYGERKDQEKYGLYAVPPSEFRHIEDEEQLPDSILADIQHGLLTSALIDSGKIDLLTTLIEHMSNSLKNFRVFLSLNVKKGNESLNPPNELLTWVESDEPSPLLVDGDFRALLQLVGYHIPESANDSCYLVGSVDVPVLEQSLQTIQKYLSTPFETRNGFPSSSYLIRPRVQNIDSFKEDGTYEEDNSQSYEGPGIVSDNDVNEWGEDSYFNDLGNEMIEKIEGRTLEKGLAKAKKSRKSRKIERKTTSKRRKIRSNIPLFDTNEPEKVHSGKARQFVPSKEYISDSDDGEDYVNPIFFENEMYMRFLLDRYSGQLTEDKYSLFGKFAAERMNNGGQIISDFTNLFNGEVPTVDFLAQRTQSSSGPDRSLISLSSLISKEIGNSRGNNTSVEIQGASVGYDFQEDQEEYSSPTSSSKNIEKNPTENFNMEESMREEEEFNEPLISRKRQKIIIQDDDD